ncbi:hypothetical protein OUZ56_015367 [Daphnia magna]|uniref:Uncharacterized protein n=1 Tax=Daphnia magna TaxID=35525 RepID=A0ABR0AML2_9CRUS|nr:hypothetical protein OUZ56_015367 [Daphnia magna]
MSVGSWANRERERGRGDVTNVISVWADSILAIVEAEQLDFCSQLLGNKLFFSGTLISLVPVAAIRHIESGVERKKEDLDGLFKRLTPQHQRSLFVLLLLLLMGFF